MLIYWFYPNPGAVGYANTTVLALLIFCSALFLSSFVVALWRRRRENPVTKRLTRAWAPTFRWLGGLGIVLAIARAEGVQFLSMRVLWVLWALGLLVFVLFQAWKFRLRHYTIVPKDAIPDPREKYLPEGAKL